MSLPILDHSPQHPEPSLWLDPTTISLARQPVKPAMAASSASDDQEEYVDALGVISALERTCELEARLRQAIQDTHPLTTTLDWDFDAADREREGLLAVRCGGGALRLASACPLSCAAVAGVPARVPSLAPSQTTPTDCLPLQRAAGVSGGQAARVSLPGALRAGKQGGCCQSLHGSVNTAGGMAW